MNIASIRNYTIFCTLILLILFGGGYYTSIINEQSLAFRNYFFDLIIYSIIGFIIGIEHLILEKKKNGIWRINYYKLFIMGLPLLYCALTLPLYFSSIPFLRVIGRPLSILSKNLHYIYCIILLLTYIITTSFYKEDPTCK